MTPTDFPDICAHELFERQAARTPLSTALVFGNERISYQDLNERANKLARRLKRLGVGPDGLVGVCLHRRPEMVVALLAVWKAGGAYVPLDPSYPPERLSFMVEDAQANVLLTEEKCRPLFAALGDAAFYLDTQWSTVTGEVASNLEPSCDPSHLAYVMPHHR